MQIYLSNSGQEPIYAQITRQIKQQILSGALHPGDALPSIRAALSLRRTPLCCVKNT